MIYWSSWAVDLRWMIEHRCLQLSLDDLVQSEKSSFFLIEDNSLFFSGTSKQYKSLLSKDMLDAMIQIGAQQTQGDKITDNNTGLPFVVSVFSDLLAGRWQLVFGANISNCPATRAMLDISEGSILLCVVTSRAAHSARDKEKESRNQHSKDYWGSLISFCATPAIHSGCSRSVKRIGK